jgi:hypothetical protein
VIDFWHPAGDGGTTLPVALRNEFVFEKVEILKLCRGQFQKEMYLSNQDFSFNKVSKCQSRVSRLS